jgi:hypothetical protein
VRLAVAGWGLHPLESAEIDPERTCDAAFRLAQRCRCTKSFTSGGNRSNSERAVNPNLGSFDESSDVVASFDVIDNGPVCRGVKTRRGRE